MKSIRTDRSIQANEGDERIRTAVPAPSDDPVYDHRAYRARFSRLHEGVDGRLHPWWCMAVPWVGVKVGKCDCTDLPDIEGRA